MLAKTDKAIEYEKLMDLTPSQKAHLVMLLNLKKEHIPEETSAIVSEHILTLTQQQYGEDWKSTIDVALNTVLKDTRGYFERKLGHISDFLVDPPEPVQISKGHKGTVKQLREALKKRDRLEEPQLIKVKGTLFPAALLSAGWWESVRTEVKINWQSELKGLQQWLFEGFDLWAPSWDISWDFEDTGQGAKPYYIAQLTDGDEADSLAVIIPPKLARVWREKFLKSWGGLEVEITGILGHRCQARKEFQESAPFKGQAQDYCVWLKDDDEHCTIVESIERTDLYSGYLWKCLIPRQWLEENDLIGLGQVYMVWEHTNFAAKEALKYNLSSLDHKVSQIAKLHRKHGGLVLLQKSHGVLVPGDPLWPVEDFYKLLLREKVKKPAGLLNNDRPHSKS